MKFLSSLIERYRQLETTPPEWVNEYTTGMPGPVIPATTPTSAPGSSTIKTDIDNLLKVQRDPELEKRKKELDDLYKQVSAALKKKAIKFYVLNHTKLRLIAINSKKIRCFYIVQF